MSDNPFASPNPLTEPGLQVPSAGFPMKPITPGWVTAICVLSLVLGVLGLLTACMTAGGMVVNQTMQTRLENEDTEMAKAQVRLYRETNRFLIPNIIFQVASLALAAVLIIGSIMTLTRKSNGPGLLRKVFLIAIGFNVLRSIFGLYVQIRMKDVTLSAMMAGNPNPQMMKQMMDSFYFVGLAVSVIFALALVAFYFFSYRYFGSETARKYFATFG